MYEDTIEAAPPRKVYLPLGVTALVMIALLLAGEPPRDIGLVPHSLGSALLPFLIFWFGFGRKRDPRIWWKAALLLFALALATNWLAAGARGARDNERRAVESIGQQVESILDSDGRNIGKIEHSGATGAAGEIERASKAWLQALVTDRQAYERDLERAGIDEMLNVRSPSPRHLSETVERMDTLDAVYATHRQIHDRRWQEAEHIYDGAGSGPAARGAKAGLLKSLPESRRRATIIWDYEGRILAEARRAIDVLRRRNWKLENGKLAFTSDDDLAAYNRHVATIQRFAREQEVEAKANQTRSRETLKQLRGNNRL